jgi:hypothetical protein
MSFSLIIATVVTTKFRGRSLGNGRYPVQITNTIQALDHKSLYVKYDPEINYSERRLKKHFRGCYVPLAY